MNDFGSDLRFSLNKENCETLDNFYWKKFVGLKSIERITDLDLQYKGYDKILHFKSGGQIILDEKVRRKKYNELFLEDYSDYDAGIDGWMDKKDYCPDYIVFLMQSTNTVYLLPFYLLKIVWKKYYGKFVGKYGYRFALNQYYRTRGIPVPPNVILYLIRQEMKSTLSKP